VALYLEHFGLSEPPFRITPHIDFFFDGADRGATLEALAYAVLHDEGIVKVSGEVGSGKTMLSRVLIERLPPEVDTIYLATPSLAHDEILHAIGDELKLSLSRERRSVALRELQEHLIKLYGAGRRVVVLIDEAHVMPEDTLEQVRLLSNLESNRHKLLQIVLFGQPELDATLAKRELRQLRDRITHGFRMRPLSTPEVARYVSFRMRAAGYRGPEVFHPRAVSLIARASGGLNRRINILADKALLAAFTESAHAVTDKHVRAAVADSEFAAVVRRAAPRAAVIAGAALAAGIALGAAVPWLIAALNPGQTAAARPAVARPAPPTPAPVVPAVALAVESGTPAPPAEPPQPASRLKAGQLQRIAGYATDGQQLLAERIAATREVLGRSPDERYSIELYTTENADPGRMQRFLLRARDWVPLEALYVIPLASGPQYRLRVTLGNYDSHEQALEAVRRLPPRYQQAFRAAPRSFGELRGQI
jgi:type II secretory pathway predicted ATPase ExeA